MVFSIKGILGRSILFLLSCLFSIYLSSSKNVSQYFATGIPSVSFYDSDDFRVERWWMYSVNLPLVITSYQL